MKFDALVFIGRFQPFHLGHEAVVREALEQAKEVIIVVGSSFAARDPIKNPFTFEERKSMIKAVFPQENVKVVPISDYPYDDNKWVAAVQSVVYSTMKFSPDPLRIGLIGHSKDKSSYYLKIFPAWESVEVEDYMGINATDIRKKFFNHQGIPTVTTSTAVRKYLGIWDHNAYMNMVSSQEEIKHYHDLWKDAPFPPTFVTTDAVLTQSGYLLLVERGKFPYKGCWALPGGYLEQGISIVDNMVKELHEETRVKVPAKVLKGSIRDTMVFDKPDRDPRGRTITHAFYIDLGFPEEKLPKVKGGDDAAKAKWFKFSDLRQDMMAFDHWHIINYFLNLG